MLSPLGSPGSGGGLSRPLWLGAGRVSLPQVLDLHHNQLTALPEDIGQLTALQVRNRTPTSGRLSERRQPPRPGASGCAQRGRRLAPPPLPLSCLDAQRRPRHCSLGCGPPPTMFLACPFGDFIVSFHSFTEKDYPVNRESTF